MKKPTNQIAEIIAKLEQENWSSQNSIDHFQALLAKNIASIAELEPLATWEEVEEEIYGIPVEQIPQEPVNSSPLIEDSPEEQQPTV